MIFFYNYSDVDRETKQWKLQIGRFYTAQQSMKANFIPYNFDIFPVELSSQNYKQLTF